MSIVLYCQHKYFCTYIWNLHNINDHTIWGTHQRTNGMAKMNRPTFCLKPSKLWLIIALKVERSKLNSTPSTQLTSFTIREHSLPYQITTQLNWDTTTAKLNAQWMHMIRTVLSHNKWLQHKFTDETQSCHKVVYKYLRVVSVSKRIEWGQ